MNRWRISLCMAALVGVTSPALAWAPQGHQMIGAIADALLADTRAGAQVRSILGPHETLQIASVWADCVRSVKETPPYPYKVDDRYVECRAFETASGERAMRDYVRRNLSACRPRPGEETCHKQYHYANIAVQRDAYRRGEAGTSDHDVVAAAQACIAVLRGRRAPAPFNIASKREALRLLAHFVEDMHQPLHTGTVYLDPAGRLVDPDQTGLDMDTATRGGNLLLDGTENLHHEWDAIPESLQVPAFLQQAVAGAAAVPATTGAMSDWPAQWTTESLLLSHRAFAPLSFGAETHPKPDQHDWPVTEPADYAAARVAIQQEQLVKGGARLAQLLKAIWP